MCISNEKKFNFKISFGQFLSIQFSSKPKAQKLIIDLSILESKYILNVGKIMKASLEHNSIKWQCPHFVFFSFHVFGISCLILWFFVFCNFRGRWGPVRSPFDVTTIWPSPMTPMVMMRNIVVMIEITINVIKATMTWNRDGLN